MLEGVKNRREDEVNEKRNVKGIRVCCLRVKQAQKQEDPYCNVDYLNTMEEELV